MAMATPVITTSRTVTSLQTQVEQDILVADTPQAIAQLVVDVLTNDTLGQQVGRAGRQYVETHHDWQVVATKLETVYRAVLPWRVH